jgi:DNA-binding CsgD family transcriptional regulator
MSAETTTMGDHRLRPVERCVLRLVAGGVDHAEIARRFRRQPEFVDRVIAYTLMPRVPEQPAAQALRPLERRVLKWRAGGADHADIGRRFHRSADHIELIERLAAYKQAR